MWWLIGAGVGAIAGAVGTYQRGKKEQEAIEQQKKNAWQQYLLGKELSDTQFGIQKNEALDQLSVQRRNLDTQVGLATDEFNTGLLGQAFGIQDARIENSSAIGMSRSAEGSSGTRGNTANERARDYATQGLERNIELQGRQNSDYLNNMITGANMESDAINREKATWMPGGYRVQMKDAQDAYNLGMANLGQSDFNWRIDQATPGFLDYFTGAIGGASSGMSMGKSVDNFRDAFNGIGK